MNSFTMKSLRSVFSGIAATTMLSIAAFAADPTGTWKWSATGPNGQSRDLTLKLALKGGQLTGAVSGTRAGETAISDASFKDDAIAFTIIREYNGNKIETKYEGKLAADSIKGKIRTTRGDAEVKVSDWSATRSKEDAAAAKP